MDARLLITVLSFSLGLSACSLFQRSEQSGYNSYNSYRGDDFNDFRRERQAFQKENARAEMGLAGASELNDDQRSAVDTRLQLQRLERTLVGRREKEQYYKYKPLMRGDRERIAFLEADSVEARDQFLNARGLSLNSYRTNPENQKLIQQNDIAIGMSKQAVKESWGDPEKVEIAGNSIYGNERWTYREYVITEEGYRPENRIIYFEAGRVVGWEKSDPNLNARLPSSNQYER